MTDTDDLMEPLLASMRQAADHRKDGDGHTLRENLIEAAVAVWQQRSDEQITASPIEHCTALIDALLPRIREHVAAAVQGERERLQRVEALREYWDTHDPYRVSIHANQLRAALDGTEATDG